LQKHGGLEHHHVDGLRSILNAAIQGGYVADLAGGTYTIIRRS